jgi:hypothetical protein
MLKATYLALFNAAKNLIEITAVTPESSIPAAREVPQTHRSD